nr:unnamed protein product [Haemonchus contortus]
MKLLFIFAVATLVHIGLAKVTNKNGILGYRYRSNDDKHGKSHENETTDGLERKEYEEVDGRNFSGLGSHGKVEQHSNDGLAHLHGHGMRQQDQKPLKNQDETQDDDDDGDDDGGHWHPHDDRHGHEERHHKHHHKPRHKHRNRRYDDEEDYYQDDKDPHAHDTHGAHHHDDHHKVVRRQRRHHHHDYGYDDDDN